MASTVIAQDQFARMVRDLPRDQLPQDACWTLKDWIPGQLDFALSKRGGWAYASGALTSVVTGADRVIAVAYAPFASGAQLCAVVRDDGGPATKLASSITTGGATDRNTVNVPDEHPTFYRNNLYITAASGAANLDIYSGSADVTDATGSPPQGSKSTVHKDHLVVAASAAQLQRVYFAGAGDPTAWDTTYGFIDTDGPVTGLYSLRSALLVFHNGTTQRIIGSYPPPGTDMSLMPLSDIGTTHAMSLAGTDEFVCFANGAGAYMTDGAGVVNLTRSGGIESYYQSLVSTATTLNLAGGFYRGHYILSIYDGNTTAVATLVCRIADRHWFQWTNVTASSFTRRVSGKEELYWGDYSAARVNTTSDMFLPTSTNKADGDSTAVAPVLETAYFRGGKSKSVFRRAFISYDLRDAATDNPILTVAYALNPEDTSYVTTKDVAGNNYTLAETSSYTRVRRNINNRAYGCSLKISQTNNSSVTRLHRLEFEATQREDNLD